MYRQSHENDPYSPHMIVIIKHFYITVISTNISNIHHESPEFLSKTQAGWWFGSFFFFIIIFPNLFWMMIQSDELIFVRGVGSTTKQIINHQ